MTRVGAETYRSALGSFIGVADREIDPQFYASALVIIDTQRDVLDDGALTVEGTSAALPAMRRLLDAFRGARRPIVHIVRIYEQDASNADLCRRELLREGAPILIRGSTGSQIAPELLPEASAELDAGLLLGGGVQQLGPSEVVIFKPRWGAFYQTPLEDHLRGNGVTTIVFAGCNFPNCPRTSIYEASERDFRVVLVRDAISGLYERGEQELSGIGVGLMDASEVEASLRAPVGSS
jgi:nicotinamidase-related amidase